CLSEKPSSSPRDANLSLPPPESPLHFPASVPFADGSPLRPSPRSSDPALPARRRTKIRSPGSLANTVRWVLAPGRSESRLSWCALLFKFGGRPGAFLVARAKLFRHSRPLHP